MGSGREDEERAVEGIWIHLPAEKNTCFLVVF